jgi:cellobiose-specific phosphotransferase system component IIA
MAKSTPSCVDEVAKKEMFTQDQVQEMISQATQQLNEAWEKRFQSLEQRMQGTVSSEAPQVDT